MMKVYVPESVFGTANLIPRQTGLKVDIWSEHRGQHSSQESHKESPRVKLSISGDEISISIERFPQIVAPKGCKEYEDLNKFFKYDHVLAFIQGIKYVGKNYDLFLKHYQDTELDDYSDYDLMKDLHERGYLKF